MLSRQRHPHVLRLLCACLHPPDTCFLGTELLSGAMLEEWLHGRRERRPRASSPPPLALVDKRSRWPCDASTRRRPGSCTATSSPATCSSSPGCYPALGSRTSAMPGSCRTGRRSPARRVRDHNAQTCICAARVL